MPMRTAADTVIRLEEIDDRAHSVEVERRAFEHSPSGDPANDIGAIVERVRDEDGSFALVAQEHGDILGHVQFSRGWVGETPVVTLGPVGVVPERQNRGIGSTLIRTGLEEARRRGEIAAIVLGDPRYYKRFGFETGSTLGLRNPATGVTPGGFEILEEHFMVAPLAPGGVELAGDVRWHPALG
jgi:predicted N-acetyltransferase YhbS